MGSSIFDCTNCTAPCRNTAAEFITDLPVSTFGGRYKAADDGDLRNGLRDLIHHLRVALDEGRFFQQVARRIAADSQFRKENHLRAQRKGLARRLYDLFGITGEITNGWVDLPESNLHTSSLNRSLILRQPSHSGGVLVWSWGVFSWLSAGCWSVLAGACLFAVGAPLRLVLLCRWQLPGR